MKKAKILAITLSIIFFLSMSQVPLANALERDYSVFIFFQGSDLIMSDILSFTPDGALILDTSYGSGIYVDFLGSFVGAFFTTDLYPAPAIITMVGIMPGPVIVATGLINSGGNTNVFFLTGILLYDYDYEEDEEE